MTAGNAIAIAHATRPGRRSKARLTFVPSISMAMEAAAESVEVPAQVIGQPLPQAEARFAGHAICPRAGNLRDAPARYVRFHHGLHADLEPALALERQALEERRTVHLERVGDVFRRNAGEEVQRKPRSAGEQTLQERPADLLAAFHVPRTAHHVVALM